eukprot:6194584-Pleurochrysis_carterae.AAC.5
MVVKEGAEVGVVAAAVVRVVATAVMVAEEAVRKEEAVLEKEVGRMGKAVAQGDTRKTLHGSPPVSERTRRSCIDVFVAVSSYYKACCSPTARRLWREAPDTLRQSSYRVFFRSTLPAYRTTWRYVHIQRPSSLHVHH